MRLDGRLDEPAWAGGPAHRPANREGARGGRSAGRPPRPASCRPSRSCTSHPLLSTAKPEASRRRRWAATPSSGGRPPDRGPRHVRPPSERLLPRVTPRGPRRGTDLEQQRGASTSTGTGSGMPPPGDWGGCTGDLAIPFNILCFRRRWPAWRTQRPALRGALPGDSPLDGRAPRRSPRTSPRRAASRASGGGAPGKGLQRAYLSGGGRTAQARSRREATCSSTCRQPHRVADPQH